MFQIKNSILHCLKTKLVLEDKTSFEKHIKFAFRIIRYD